MAERYVVSPTFDSDLAYLNYPLPVSEQVWSTTPEGTYGAGEEIDLFVGFRFPILLESDTAFLSVNTVGGGEQVSEKDDVIVCAVRRLTDEWVGVHTILVRKTLVMLQKLLL